MRFRIVILACVVSFLNCEGQSKKPPTKPTRPSSEIQEPTPQSKAAEAADKYMRGLRLADLPEGRQMLQEVQWVTGPADYGSNFYDHIVYTESSTLFEGLFNTDIPGISGFKRLMEIKAVSNAGTPILARYLLVAFPDKKTGNWKIAYFGDIVDIDREVSASYRDLTDTTITSAQENYSRYAHGFW